MSLTNPSAAPNPQAFARVERLARLLDEAVTIPFTRIKVGLDSIIGLVPGVGDFAGFAIGSYLVWEAHRLGAPAELKLKMARNVVVDTIAGFVPVLGDAVDMIYRSNRRNIELMRGHFRPLEVKAAVQRPHWLVWAVRLALAGGVVALVWWWRQP